MDLAAGVHAPGRAVNPLSQRAAEFLLDSGKIGPEQLDEARRTQGFFGGDLVTHLLKLGFVDEQTAGEALTEASGVPYASGERLRSIPLEALSAIPAELAQKHRAVPFRLEDRRLRVAMLNPRDRVAIDEIRSASGYAVEPWITTEYRLYQALERHYKVRIPGTRAIALAPHERPRRKERRATVPAEQDQGPRRSAEPELGLDGLPLDADIAPDFAFGASSGVGADEEPSDALEAVPSRSVPPDVARPGDFPLAALERTLAAAESRESVAAALVEFGARRARRAVLFAVGREGLRGVDGRGPAVSPEKIREAKVGPLEGTVFEMALSRDFYFGPVAPLPEHRDLFERLFGRPPQMVLLLPIRVKEKTAALLYLDGDSEPMLRPDIPLMKRVAAKAGLALEILLLKKKLLEL